MSKVIGSEDHLWVLEYGISHGRRMLVCAHHGDYPRGTYLRLHGVRYFHGPLEGGPFELRMVASDSGEALVGEVDGEEQLRVEFAAAELEKVRR